MMVHHNYFHFVDYIVFVLMFVISLTIGIFFAIKSRHKNTPDEYLMGGRKLGLMPVAISMCVSICSTNTLLGGPAEMYAYGMMYEFLCVALFLSTIIVAFTLVPLFYPLKLTSVHQYLHLRFNSKLLQYIATFILIICQILYIGTVIFGPATALQIGIPPWASIIFVSVIGTIYTSFGGMKAVVWADVFQSCVMVAGLLAIIIEGSRIMGGLDKVWEANVNGGRLHVLMSSSLTERYTIVSTSVGLTVCFTAMYGANQPCVQRFSSTQTQLKSQIAMLLNGPAFSLFATLSVGVGMVAFAYYDAKGCDPLASGQLENANQITPYFVMEILGYPGLPGLFMSTLFSASLSTFSSSINAMAAVLWEDVLEHRYSDLTEGRKTFITKVISIIFGLVCMSTSFIIMHIGGTLTQVSTSFLGMTLGPLLGLFTLGALFPFANWLGGLAGVVVGLGINAWLTLGQVLNKSGRLRLPSKTDGCLTDDILSNSTSTVNLDTWTNTTVPTPIIVDGYTTALTNTTDINQLAPWLKYLYSISFNWYSVIGFVLVILVGVLVSLITACIDQPEVEGKYLFSFIRKCTSKKHRSYSLVERSSSFAYEDGRKKVHQKKDSSF